MLYLLLADFVLLLHLLFILFVIFGGLLGFYRAVWLRWHLPALGWAVLLELLGWRCPLTPAEFWLIRLGEEAGYAEGGLQPVLMPLIYPVDLTRESQIAMGLGLLLLNACIYCCLWRYYKRKRNSG